MKHYTASVPLYLEFISPEDKHDFSFGFDVEMNYKLTVTDSGIDIEVVKSKENGFQLVLKNILESSESAAFIKTCKIMDRVCSAMSLNLQRSNPNQHYGHPRFFYYKKDVNIAPRDQWPSDSLGIKCTQHIKNYELVDRIME